MNDQNSPSQNWRRALALASIFIVGLGTIAGSGHPHPETPMRLTVQTFGSGTVQSGTALDCGATCSAQYEVNEQVTMNATPAAGWTFHHWSGCDTVSGSSCLVTMNVDRVVYPTFVTTTATLKPTVKLLSPQTVAQLTSVAGSTMIFAAGTSEMATLQPGDLIVSQVGNGFAKRVQAIEARSGLPIFVTVTNAALDEVLMPGTLVFNEFLKPDQVVGATDAGGEMKRPLASGSGVEFTIGPRHQEVDGVSVDVLAVLTFKPDFALSVGLNGIKEFRSAVEVTGTTKLTVSSASKVNLAKQEFLLQTIRFAPVLVGPVVLVPTVEVTLSFNADAEAAVTAKVSFSERVTRGIQYLASSKDWSPVAPPPKFETSFDPPTITATFEAKAALGVKGSMMVYGVAGPFVEAELYVRGEAKAKPVTNCLDWGLFYGLDVSAGGKFSVLSWVLTEVKLEPIPLPERPLARANPAACADKTSPSDPTGLSVKATSSSALALEWSPSSDDTQVATYKVQRNNESRAESPLTRFVDFGLEAGKNYCYRVSAIDSSGNESGFSATECAKTLAGGDTVAPSAPLNLVAKAVSTNSIQLSWSASSDNVGVTGYILLRNGSVVWAGEGTAARDSGLQRESRYCYQVVAHDAALNLSARSTEACATTATDGGWDAYVKCIDRNTYVLKFNLDVDGSADGIVQNTGSGFDYPGTPFNYVMSGKLNPTTGVFDGEMTWAFAGQACIRRDKFSVSLAGADTQDQSMSPVSICGACVTQIRFRTFGSAPLGSGQAGTLQVDGSGSLSRQESSTTR